MLGRFIELTIRVVRAYEDARKTQNGNELGVLLDEWMRLTSDKTNPFRIIPDTKEMKQYRAGFPSFRTHSDEDQIIRARQVLKRCVVTLVRSWWVGGNDGVAGFRPALEEDETGEMMYHFVADSLRGALAAHLTLAIASRVEVDDPGVIPYRVCKNKVCGKLFVSHKDVDYPDSKTCKVYAGRGQVCPMAR